MATKPQLIVNLTRGGIVCDHAMIADRPLRRMRGLLGRDSLPAGEGLLLQPAPSVHTAFMRFPIDVIFLDRDLQVVKVVEELRPWRGASARRARSALELAAGAASASGIQSGDRLAVVTAVDQLELPDTEPAADRSRVLLVGKDRRFRSVTAALLTRRGCTVSEGERLVNVAELATQESAEVVVIDAGSSLPVAAREVAQLQTLDPPVGVVLVRDEAAEALSAMPVLPKWGSFSRLWGAIERARPTRNRSSSNGQR
jgi:uncharacterized membrane protein (UPF0127 family)